MQSVVTVCRDNAIALATSLIPKLSLAEKREALQAAVEYILKKGKLLFQLLQEVGCHCSGGSGTTNASSDFEWTVATPCQVLHPKMHVTTCQRQPVPASVPNAPVTTLVCYTSHCHTL